MSTIWALRSLTRAAVVTGFPKPGGVHLHAHLSNLAACSFAANRNKFPKASSYPVINPCQNLYGSLLVNKNNIQYDITLNRYISNRVKKDHLNKLKKPNRIQRKHTQAENGANSKTSGEEKNSDKKNNETTSTTQTNQSTTSSEQSEQDNQSEKTLQTEENESKDSTEDKPLSIFQRFKKAYKEHGKILVCVHLATSTVWFGSFYYAAKTGFDVVPLLEYWNFSETVIKPFKSSGLGNIAVAYLMYKLATPARYTVTLGGTNLCIKYFRKTGKMPPKQAEDSLREIYKEGKDRFEKSKKNVKSELRQRRLNALEKAKLKRKRKP